MPGTGNISDTSILDFLILTRNDNILGISEGSLTESPSLCGTFRDRIEVTVWRNDSEDVNIVSQIRNNVKSFMSVL